MMPMVFGSLEQAAHMFSNLFSELLVFERRHSGLCIVVETIMQGVVEAIKTKRRSFGLNNDPAAFGLEYRCIVWPEHFKGSDA